MASFNHAIIHHPPPKISHNQSFVSGTVTPVTLIYINPAFPFPSSLPILQISTTIASRHIPGKHPIPIHDVYHHYCHLVGRDLMPISNVQHHSCHLVGSDLIPIHYVNHQSCHIFGQISIDGSFPINILATILAHIKAPEIFVKFLISIDHTHLRCLQ